VEVLTAVTHIAKLSRENSNREKEGCEREKELWRKPKQTALKYGET
jgi:hypothetical protein